MQNPLSGKTEQHCWKCVTVVSIKCYVKLLDGLLVALTVAAVAGHHGNNAIISTFLSSQRQLKAASSFQQDNTDPFMGVEILNRLGNPSLILEEPVRRQGDGCCPPPLMS